MQAVIDFYVDESSAALLVQTMLYRGLLTDAIVAKVLKDDRFPRYTATGLQMMINNFVRCIWYVGNRCCFDGLLLLKDERPRLHLRLLLLPLSKDMREFLLLLL